MRILFLSQLLPYPLDSGAKTRAYYVLRYLAQKYQVTLLAFTRPDDPPEAVTHLKEFCDELHTIPMHRSRWRDMRALLGSLLNYQSFVIRRDYVPEMVQKIRELVSIKDYDAIHADQLWMAQYASLAREYSGVNKKPLVILDEHNACFQILQRLAQGEHNLLKRIYLEREWRYLRNYEIHACANSDKLVTVTEEDRFTLMGLLQDQKHRDHKPKVATIPICVETETISPLEPVETKPNVLHMGTMFWLPNIEGVLWFAKEVWPLVKAEIPSVTLTVIGKNPPPSILDLGKDFGNQLNIEVTGYVPDPEPYLKKAKVFIVPLLSGGGMRVKIVEGWRWGLPIVSTTIGAEGIHYRDGENILIADSPQEFANAIVRTLSDLGLANRLRENGRCWVEQNYNWRTVYKAWVAIYNS